MNNLDVVFDALEEVIEREFGITTDEVQRELSDFGVYDTLRLMLIGDEE